MTDLKADKPGASGDIALSNGQDDKESIPLEAGPGVLENEADQARIAEIAAGIDFSDPSLTIAYGSRPMAEIAKFADDLLAQVRERDSGPAGQTLSSLLARIKETNIAETAGQEPGWTASLPLIGGLFDPMARAQASFNSLADSVDNVVINLQEALTRLLRDIEVMERFYALNRNFHHELTLDIAAGKKRLEQAYTEDLPRLQARSIQTGGNEPDNMAAQVTRDFADRLNRFERRLHDLQLARTVTLQTAPQIRLIQGNDQTLAEKIQAGILTAIPIWKAQMVLALSIHGQKQAARLQQEVSDTTNELLRKNAELLHDATISTARETERGVVDIESLREVHARLLSTVEETLRIAAEARDKRREVEKELQRMEGDLHDRLIDLGHRKDAQYLDHIESKAFPPPKSAEASSPRAANAGASEQAGSKTTFEYPPGGPQVDRKRLGGSQLNAPRLEEQAKPVYAPIAVGRGDVAGQAGGPPIAMGPVDAPGGQRE